jgi:hypothetical protein
MASEELLRSWQECLDSLAAGLQNTFIRYFTPKVSFGRLGPHRFLRWVWIPRRLLPCSDRHRDFLLAEQLGRIAAGMWKAELLLLLSLGSWLAFLLSSTFAPRLKLAQIGFALCPAGAFFMFLYVNRKAWAHADEITLSLLGREAFLDGILWSGEVFGYGLTKLTEGQRTRLRKVGYLTRKDRNSGSKEDSRSHGFDVKESPPANGSTLKWLKEGLLLIVSPGIAAYALTYLHAAGYSSRFRIPWHFVSPNSSDIAEYLVVLTLVIALPLVALNLVSTGAFRDTTGPVDIYPFRHLLRLVLFVAFAWVTFSLVRPPR